MVRYHTTNLRFPPQTYEELRRRAAGRGVSMADLVREAVAQYLGGAEAANALPFGEDPVDALVGAFAAGTGDESLEHDHYLYAWSKEGDGETPSGRERAAGPLPSRRPQPSRRGGKGAPR